MNAYYKKIEKDLKNDQNKKIREKLHKLKVQKALLRVLQCLKASYPYLISAGVITGLFMWIGIGAPFVRDKRKAFLQKKVDIDSFGNKTLMTEYSNENLPDGKISYTTKWSMNEDGVYERSIKEYDISKINEQIIIESVLNDEDIKDLDEIFGKPISDKNQIAINLTEEEINKQDCIEATIYSIDENEVMKVEESASQNVLATLVWVMAQIVPSLLIFVVRAEKFGYLLSNEMTKITYNYEDKLEELWSEKQKNKKLERTNVK